MENKAAANLPPPWERQIGETHKQFAHFVLFRDLPPDVRTVVAAYRLATGNKTARTAAGWWSEQASKWKWLERAACWDNEQDRLLRAKKTKAIEEMAERHAAVATLFIKNLIDRLTDFNPADLSPADLVRWFDTAVKVERLSRGEPTEIEKTEGKPYKVYLGFDPENV